MGRALCVPLLLCLCGIALVPCAAQLTGGSGTTSPAAATGTPNTRYLQLDFASVLEGAGCGCNGELTQAAFDAKCATCECSDYGCCRPPDCDNPQCGGSGPTPPCVTTDCTRCSTGGPENRTCVTTPVLRQCAFSQGVTVMNPFQVVAKVTVVFWDDVAYAWVNYAANSERASLAIVSNDANNAATFQTSIFSGQNATVLPTLPGFTAANGPQLFYNTGIFGPLNWSVLGPRFGPSAAASVGIRLCTTATPSVCTTSPCLFGVDRPVLRPADL